MLRALTRSLAFCPIFSFSSRSVLSFTLFALLNMEAHRVALDYFATQGQGCARLLDVDAAFFGVTGELEGNRKRSDRRQAELDKLTRRRQDLEGMPQALHPTLPASPPRPPLSCHQAQAICGTGGHFIENLQKFALHFLYVCMCTARLSNARSPPYTQHTHTHTHT